MKKGMILLTGTMLLLSLTVFAGNGMNGRGRNNNSNSVGYGNCMNNFNRMNYQNCDYNNQNQTGSKNNKGKRIRNKILLGKDQEIHNYFINKYDTDKNGMIDGNERESFLKEHNELIQKFDKNNNGNLSEDELDDLKSHILNK